MPTARGAQRLPRSIAWIQHRTRSSTLLHGVAHASLMLIGSRIGISTLHSCISPAFRSLRAKPVVAGSCRSSLTIRGCSSARSSMESVALRPLWIDTDTGIDDAQGNCSFDRFSHAQSAMHNMHGGILICRHIACGWASCCSHGRLLNRPRKHGKHGLLGFDKARDKGALLLVVSHVITLRLLSFPPFTAGA